MEENNKSKEEKKIIIDEDWKQQAQKEKEILSAKEADEKKDKTRTKGERPPLPRGDFAALISMLVTQALFALGALEVEGQEDKQPDLELARYNIDMLYTLEEKTKGNLSEQEQKALSSTLNQVRMAFVSVSEQAGK